MRCLLFLFLVFGGHVVQAFSNELPLREEFWKQLCHLAPGIPNPTATCVKRYVEVVSAGSYHTCALTSKGGYECVGRDSSSQAPKTLQLPKDNSSTYIQVSAGQSYTCALTSKGGYECVGDNKYGQARKTLQLPNDEIQTPTKDTFGVSHTSQLSVEVSAGYRHTCALTSTGGYECVCSNSYGRAPKTLQLPKDKSSTYIQESAGTAHTCALPSKGGYECVGGNSGGRAPKTLQLQND
jgi:alpha-tubulin suppressor-like RCC1 family protein